MISFSLNLKRLGWSQDTMFRVWCLRMVARNVFHFLRPHAQTLKKMKMKKTREKRARTKRKENTYLPLSRRWALCKAGWSASRGGVYCWWRRIGGRTGSSKRGDSGCNGWRVDPLVVEDGIGAPTIWTSRALEVEATWAAVFDEEDRTLANVDSTLKTVSLHHSHSRSSRSGIFLNAHISDQCFYRYERQWHGWILPCCIFCGVVSARLANDMPAANNILNGWEHYTPLSPHNLLFHPVCVLKDLGPKWRRWSFQLGPCMPLLFVVPAVVQWVIFK